MNLHLLNNIRQSFCEFKFFAFKFNTIERSLQCMKATINFSYNFYNKEHNELLKVL